MQRSHLLHKGVDPLLGRDLDTGKAMLRDYIKATMGLKRLAPSASMIQTSSYCPETAPTFLGFAPIQRLECKQDPAGLPPKTCFIAAEAIECEIGQISQT